MSELPAAGTQPSPETLKPVQKSWQAIHRFAAPENLYQVLTTLLPYLAILTLCSLLLGLYLGFVVAPADAVQGEGFRIIYLHVPAAILSVSIYAIMACYAILGLVWRVKMAFVCCRESAILGFWITALTLFTGALWGKPMWGAWWVWDARLTAELILLFLYAGYLAILRAIPNPKTAQKAGAILVLVGAVDLPIIHYSVNWWHTLHQGSSLTLLGKTTIAPTMLHPLLVMIIGMFCFYLLALALRLRVAILKLEQGKQWLSNLCKISEKSLQQGVDHE